MSTNDPPKERRNVHDRRVTRPAGHLSRPKAGNSGPNPKTFGTHESLTKTNEDWGAYLSLWPPCPLVRRHLERGDSCVAGIPISRRPKCGVGRPGWSRRHPVRGGVKRAANGWIPRRPIPTTTALTPMGAPSNAVGAGPSRSPQWKTARGGRRPCGFAASTQRLAPAPGRVLPAPQLRKVKDQSERRRGPSARETPERRVDLY